MRSKFFRFVLASVVWSMLLAFGAASADQYSWELSGTRLQADLPYLATGSAASTSIAATHYFTPIDDTLGPYLYAPFLTRSSRITASVSHTAIDRTVIGFVPPIVSSTVTDRMDSYSVAGRNVWRDSGWYVGGGAQHAHMDFGLTPSYGATANSDWVRGGKFLGRSTSLDLTLESSQALTNPQPLLCSTSPCILSIDGFESTDDIGVEIRHLGGLAGMHYAVTGRVTSDHIEFRYQGALLFSGRTRNYAISGELFPTARLGIRLDYSSLSNDFGRHGASGLSASWFFKRNVAVRFSWSPANYPGYSGNDDGAQLSVLGRF